MSLSNITGTTGFIPQFATNPLTGQLFMIAPNQHQLGVSYLWPRSYMEGQPNGLQMPQPIQQRILPQHTSHQITNQLPPPQPPQALPQSPPKREVEVESQFQLKDQTNATVRNIKEKCISHYIEGQLIIETSRPLSELRLKSLKKKEKKKQLQKVAKHPKHQPSQVQPQQPQIQHQSPQVHHQSPQVQHQPAQVQIQQSHTPPVNQEQKQVQIYNQSGSEVQRIRAEMPNWSVAEVVEFIEKHEDIKQYSHKFAEDEMDGKALLIMIDRNLNFQILSSMFKHGPAMKIEAALSKYKLNE